MKSTNSELKLDRDIRSRRPSAVNAFEVFIDRETDLAAEMETSTTRGRHYLPPDEAISPGEHNISWIPDSPPRRFEERFSVHVPTEGFAEYQRGQRILNADGRFDF